MDMLNSGVLLPSTNYSIDCEFRELSSKLTMVCTIKNLEDGELIASDSIQEKNISQITIDTNKIAKALYSSLK